MISTGTRFWADLQFWLAVLAGPLAWLVLWLAFDKPAINSVPAKVWLFAVLIYPVVEELAFRGFIQSWLLQFQRFSTPIVSRLTGANLVTSLVFAALHLVSQSPLWAMSVFFPSLVFGYLRERFDSVAPAILMHIWYNLGFISLFY